MLNGQDLLKLLKKKNQNAEKIALDVIITSEQSTQHGERLFSMFDLLINEFQKNEKVQRQFIEITLSVLDFIFNSYSFRIQMLLINNQLEIVIRKLTESLTRFEHERVQRIVDSINIAVDLSKQLTAKELLINDMLKQIINKDCKNTKLLAQIFILIAEKYSDITKAFYQQLSLEIQQQVLSLFERKLSANAYKALTDIFTK